MTLLAFNGASYNTPTWPTKYGRTPTSWWHAPGKKERMSPKGKTGYIITIKSQREKVEWWLSNGIGQSLLYASPRAGFSAAMKLPRVLPLEHSVEPFLAHEKTREFWTEFQSRDPWCRRRIEQTKASVNLDR